MNGVVVWNNNQKDGGANTVPGQFASGLTTDWVSGNLGTAKNVIVADPMFRSIEPSDWDLRPAPGSPLTGARWELPANNGFFNQAVAPNACAGAICGSDDWTEEWTIKHQETDLRRPGQ